MKKIIVLILFTTTFVTNYSMDIFIPTNNNHTPRHIQNDIINSLKQIDCSDCTTETEMYNALWKAWNELPTKPQSYQTYLNGAALNNETSETFNNLNQTIESAVVHVVAIKHTNY